ncbi:MAG: hypothetical protein ACK5Z5_07400 [Neisseriaceae bacterium]
MANDYLIFVSIPKNKFIECIANAIQYFTQDKSGAYFVKECLKTIDTSKTAILQFAIQQTLAIGYIRDNVLDHRTNNFAFFKQEFNFSGFKMWVKDTCGEEIANKLVLECFQNIKLDANLNITFGYLNNKLLIPLTDLTIYPEKEHFQLLSIDQNKDMIFFEEHSITLVDNPELRDLFESKYGEMLQKINVDNFTCSTLNTNGGIFNIMAENDSTVKIPLSCRTPTKGEMRGELLLREIKDFFISHPNESLYSLFFTPRKFKLEKNNSFLQMVNTYLSNFHVFLYENYYTNHNDHINSINFIANIIQNILIPKTIEYAKNRYFTNYPA